MAQSSSPNPVVFFDMTLGGKGVLGYVVCHAARSNLWPA